MARTDEEVEKWLSDNMPDGPETSREQGIQDALDWVTEHNPDLERD